MLLFGHLGITLFAALIGGRLSFISKPASSSKNGISERGSIPQRNTPINKVETGSISKCEGIDNNPRTRINLFDPRFWILGSILPDLIDKPLGHLFFAQYFSGNGRIYAHTLLFTLLLIGSGLILFYKKKQSGLLSVSFGVLMHLLLDTSWNPLSTFLWPLQGTHFLPGSKGDWIGGMIEGLETSPDIYISEIAGLIICICFGIRLVLNKGILNFLKTSRY
jgi:inner membrane protein